MKTDNPNDKPENLNAGYDGIVDYHNNLVQIRFTVAGLSIAADGFLASALFNTSAPLFSKIIISVLGIILTFICGMLEIRTFQLLNKLEHISKIGSDENHDTSEVNEGEIVFKKTVVTNKYATVVL